MYALLRKIISGKDKHLKVIDQNFIEHKLKTRNLIALLNTSKADFVDALKPKAKQEGGNEEFNIIKLLKMLILFFCIQLVVDFTDGEDVIQRTK